MQMNNREASGQTDQQRHCRCQGSVLFLIVALFLLPASAAYGNSCITSECHADLGQVADLHEPVAEDCLSCHEQQEAVHPDPAAKSFRLIATGSTLCYQCHETFGAKPTVHDPVADGDCTACHNPHGSMAAKLLPDKDDQKKLCLSCHDAEMFEQQYRHGPVAAGACMFCHNPHESEKDALLRRDVQQLCLDCHEDIAQGIKQAAYVHSAITEQQCTACHRPHSGPNRFLLKDERHTLCFTCHSEIESLYEKGKSKHAALFEGKRCGNCHAVHFSARSFLLLKDEITLCLDCHSGNPNVEGASKINIKKELEREFLHEPVLENKCVSCHDPHGSKYLSLMKGAYPGSFYAPYTKGAYDFCFACHDRGMLAHSQTSTDTNFRNGTTNLHYLHVVKKQKGRTCKACHQPHASDGPKLINQKGTKFGDWEIPLNFELKENGGSCVPGCHRAVTYDRENPVDYQAQTAAD